jgi:heavy metal translocating P-type ATPase
MSACCCLPDSGAPEVCADGGRRAGAHWWRLGLAGLIAGQSMVFSFAVNLDPVSGVERWLLHGMLALASLAVFLLVGGPLARAAWVSLRERRWGVEQFFLIGIAGAFGASLHSSVTGVGDVYYEVVAVLVAIYSLGRIVADRRRDQAMGAVASLRRDFERCLRLTCCGREEEVGVAEVKAGDRVHVAAGAGVPVDGRVREGVALVSETPLNGEPFPVVKRPGDRVWAGSHAVDAALVVEAAHDGRARQLDRLLAEVEAARARPTGLQREADRIVAWFLPLVLVLSALTTAAWGLVAGWTVGLFNGLAVLVVACPCAMGLATPIAVWGALNRMARRGLVPQGGEFLERLGQVDVAVFDKTGTLTDEHLQVVDWVAAEGVDRTTLEAQIAAVQQSQSHPVARAFRAFAGSPDWNAERSALLPGQGIAASVRGPGGVHRLELGNESLGRESGEAWVGLCGRLDAAAGTRTVAVRRDGVLVAAAALRENLRSSSGSVISALAAAGVEVRVMTGDRAEHAAALGLEGVTIQAGMSAEAKAEAVRTLQQSGRRVLFVGDGINDAPAMAAAHAAVALASGAALSREASGAQLYGADLSAVVDALGAARATVRGIRTNLRVAAVYNFTGIALAMAGVLNPVAAAVLMLVSSFTVSFRALRLAEGPLSSVPARGNRRRPVPRAPWVPALAGAVAVALAAQGLLLGHLGALPHWGAAALALGFGLVGILAWNTRGRWAVLPHRAAFVAMLAVGNLGMLLGWWADAGWAPAIRDGVCLCGCQKSHFGAGLAGGLAWMHLGMLAFSLPPIWWEQRVRIGVEGRGDWRWLACLAFMVLGMQAGAGAVIGWFPAQPQAQLLASYAGMTIGMTAAMLVVCGSRLWTEARAQRRSAWA